MTKETIYKRDTIQKGHYTKETLRHKRHYDKSDTMTKETMTKETITKGTHLQKRQLPKEHSTNETTTKRDTFYVK